MAVKALKLRMGGEEFLPDDVAVAELNGRQGIETLEGARRRVVAEDLRRRAEWPSRH